MNNKKGELGETYSSEPDGETGTSGGSERVRDGRECERWDLGLPVPKRAACQQPLGPAERPGELPAQKHRHGPAASCLRQVPGQRDARQPDAGRGPLGDFAPCPDGAPCRLEEQGTAAPSSFPIDHGAWETEQNCEGTRETRDRGRLC
ncbi:hypothetical protein H106_05641 [Trichophyton rubrum CBS 735.88]|nr:hypothetical protein H106_05641 [Trichophyton rubrum CBS 735.88]